MSKAIQSSTNAVTGVQGTAAAQPADWLARLGSDGQGANAGSFSRWMEQHKPQAQTPLPQAARTAQATPAAQTPPSASPTDTPTAAKGPGWNATQQKLAAARSQANATRAPATASQTSPGAAARQAAAAQGQARAEAAKANSANAANSANGTQNAHTAQAKRTASARDGMDTDATSAGHETEATLAADEAKDETRLVTAQGEGTAVVRELTPPPTVQANDPAGMMAWLASLTQGGEAGTHAEGSELAGTEGEGPGLQLGQDEEGRGKALGHGRGQGIAWGLRKLELGQDAAAGKAGLAAGQGDASLQVDALLGKGREAQALVGEGAKGVGQDAAALMAADGARVASFGQALSEARQAMPHAQASLPTPLDAPEFTQELADQIGLWVGQARNDGPMTAELHLNPAEMGPINVKISLDGQSAHVDFAAAALETRQAIEASLSMLSSSLNDVGLSLSGGGVFSQTPQQQQAFSQGPNGGANASGRTGQGRGDRSEGDDAEPLRQVSAPRPGRLGGLDLYA
ncbi:flagellar hook-length control protein FliK [Aquabacterium commune]|uniref:Flagellar hook-length control protein FliK n=1 Tax=Aquabacterium commune TaxID=70586 RepID=A0A4R6RNY9_9BURK|nr:flagellar hook-length control protein FliK [Aquabacterium commune]TDP87895.1 flagellar hook-length control protein FliK [Aquabacterium commune]